MLFKPALFVTSTLAILIAANPVAVRTDPSQCNTGSSNCCSSSGTASSYSGNPLFGLINLLVTDLTVAIGLQCSPILGGGSCNQTPVCCTGNNFLGGLIVVGCSPINL